MKKSTVSILRNRDITRRSLSAVKLIGGIERLVGRGDRVLIKPNWVCGHPPKTGETTNPEVVTMLVRLAKEVGAKDVLVGEGEGAFFSSPLRDIYEKQIKEARGSLIDFNEQPWVEVKVPNPIFHKTILVARALLECDVLMGAPAMKTHHLAGITGALKNLYGAFHPKDRGRYHILDRVEEAIVDINSVRSSDMVVVDATRSILHWGPLDEYLETKRFDLTIAGFDPVATDAVVAKIMGIDPRSIRYLSWAEEKGLGTADLNTIDTVGITMDEAYQEDVMTSVEYDNKKLNKIHLVNCGACTGCFGRIATALSTVDDSEVMRDICILMGPNAKSSQENEVTFLCGNCLTPTFYNKLKGVFIPGCPPNLTRLLERLEELGAKTKGHFP